MFKSPMFPVLLIIVLAIPSSLAFVEYVKTKREASGSAYRRVNTIVKVAREEGGAFESSISNAVIEAAEDGYLSMSEAEEIDLLYRIYKESDSNRKNRELLQSWRNLGD